jgi:hypothetical protein
MPTRKVSVSALSGAIVTVAVWVAHAVWNITEPPEVIAAEVVIVMTAVGYLVPEANQS